MLNSPLVRSALAGVAGFLAYGSWAIYANWDHGQDIALRSGVVQGSYSFALTLVMTLVTEWLFEMLKNLTFGILILMFSVCSVLFATAYGINYLAGTPEIIMTIFPGWVIGSIYTGVYVGGLARAKIPRVTND